MAEKFRAPKRWYLVPRLPTAAVPRLQVAPSRNECELVQWSKTSDPSEQPTLPTPSLPAAPFPDEPRMSCLYVSCGVDCWLLVCSGASPPARVRARLLRRQAARPALRLHPQRAQLQFPRCVNYVPLLFLHSGRLIAQQILGCAD